MKIFKFKMADVCHIENRFLAILNSRLPDFVEILRGEAK